MDSKVTATIDAIFRDTHEAQRAWNAGRSQRDEREWALAMLERIAMLTLTTLDTLRRDTAPWQ